MPSSSQTAISSGAGGLCAVRRAFTPILFISCICRASASKRTADPTAPSVAGRSTPWIFRDCPLSETPPAVAEEGAGSAIGGDTLGAPRGVGGLQADRPGLGRPGRDADRGAALRGGLPRWAGEGHRHLPRLRW